MTLWTVAPKPFRTRDAPSTCITQEFARALGALYQGWDQRQILEQEMPRLFLPIKKLQGIRSLVPRTGGRVVIV